MPCAPFLPICRPGGRITRPGLLYFACALVGCVFTPQAVGIYSKSPLAACKALFALSWWQGILPGYVDLLIAYVHLDGRQLQPSNHCQRLDCL